MRRSVASVCAAVLAVCVSLGEAATLSVGPARQYKRIQDAINVASDGDTILVDPGTYTGYAGCMLFDGPGNITVRGNGGRPIIDMGTDHAVSVWGKGCVNITPKSANITLENLEFKNATVRDVPPWNDTAHNGAGIRWDGAGMLRVANCVVHDCENGILGAAATGGDFLLENSVLYNNGSTQAITGTHNVYLGAAGEGSISSITVQYCWIYNAKAVHDLRLAARTMRVLYNRLGDEITNRLTTPPTTGGGRGNALDMPHGGLGYVIGNLFIKGYSAVDGNVIRYGEEGLYASYSSQLYVLYNTFIGQRAGGSNCFLVIAPGASPTYMANNASIAYNASDLPYAGSVMFNPALINSNFFVYERQGNPNPNPGMVNYSGGNPPAPEAIDVHLLSASPCVNKAVLPGNGSLPSRGPDGFSLVPTRQYVHGSGTPMVVPAALPGYQNRNSATDSGMYNCNNPPANQAPIVTAGPSDPPMASGAYGFVNRPIATVNGLLMGAAGDDGQPGPMTFTWSKLSGPGTVTFADPGVLVTTASFSTAGTYTLQLAASDGERSTAARCTVQAEQAPVLTTNVDVIYVAGGAAAHLAGTATDGDGPVALSVPSNAGWAETYRSNLDVPHGATWVPAVTPGTASSLIEDVTFDATGTFLVRLTAWDGVLFSCKTVRVGQGVLNHTPVVDAGPDTTVTLPAAATLNGSATDDDLPNPPGALRYAWSKVSGPGGVTFAEANAAGTTATFSAPGTYVLQLAACDGELTGTDTVTITANTVPIVSVHATPGFGYETWQVNLTATASDPDGDSLTFAWTQTAGKTVSLDGATTTETSFVVPFLLMTSDATMTFAVTVSDDDGNSTTGSITVQTYMIGDVNHDNYVNVGDLQALVAAWNTSCAGGPPYDLAADLNNDGYVNVGDLQVLAASWVRRLH